MARAEERREARKRAKAATATKIWLALPEDDFLDLMGEPWTRSLVDGTRIEFDFVDVLLHTTRRLPAKTFEEGERHLKLVDIFRNTRDQLDDEDEEDPTHIEMDESDYTPWLASMKDAAPVGIWNATDMVYLCKYIQESKMTKDPTKAKTKAAANGKGGTEDLSLAPVQAD